MINFNSFFTQGLQSTLRIKPGVNWSHKGPWVQIYGETEIDRWYVGDYSSANYQITVEFDSNKKEVFNALVVARPDEASLVIFGRVSIDDDLISLSATVNDSYLSLKAIPTNPVFEGVKVVFLATYTETIHDLTVPAGLTYLPENDPAQEEIIGGGGGGSGGGSGGPSVNNLNDLNDVDISSVAVNDYLRYNGISWINSPINLSGYAPINSPAFTGTVTGISAAMVGLGNVTNESKATMFNNPVFTGIVTGIDAASLNLENVTNESKATMFTNPVFTGTAFFDTINLGTGATITEFSTDSTLIDAAPDAVPTESAVKAYVDNAIALVSLNSNNTFLTGNTTIQQTSEVLNTKTSATGTVIHDFSEGAIWYHTSAIGSFIANFINVPTTNNRTNVATVIIQQGSSPYSISGVQIGGIGQTVYWLNAAVPVPLANRREIYSFALIRSANTWTVLGSLTSYG